MTFALDIQELTLCREELELIRALSLQVKPGELIQVAGPNGAGKSTLLRAIAGLYAGFEGRISIENESDAEVRRARCLLWTALPGIKSRLTAFQNLKWLLALRGDDGDCNELLSRVGLVAGKTASLVSYQRAKAVELQWPVCTRAVLQFGFWMSLSMQLIPPASSSCPTVFVTSSVRVGPCCWRLTTRQQI